MDNAKRYPFTIAKANAQLIPNFYTLVGITVKLTSIVSQSPLYAEQREVISIPTCPHQSQTLNSFPGKY